MFSVGDKIKITLVLVFCIGFTIFSIWGEKLFPEKDEPDYYSDGYYEGYDDGFEKGVNYALDELEPCIDDIPSLGFLEDIMCSYYEYPELEEMLGYSLKELEDIFDEFEDEMSSAYGMTNWLRKNY